MADPSSAVAPASVPSRGGFWASTGPYLRMDEDLRITSYNALASVVLSVRARMYEADGRVTDSIDSHTPNTNRTAATSIVRTAEGWLLGGEVFVSSAAPLLGQTFVVVEVVRGESTAAIATQLLAAGYVTAKQPLLFPQTVPSSSLDGGGALRSIAGTTPGAGAEISETVPTGARWKLLAFAAQLVTSAAAANRVPALFVDDGATVLYRAPVNVNEVASSTWQNSWIPVGSFNQTASGNVVREVLPVELFLGAGYRLRTVTTAIQAADQWSAVQYLVREWIEGA